MAGIRIDALPSATSPSVDHELPAMMDGISVKLKVQQVLDLAGIPAAISSAIGDALEALVDSTTVFTDDADPTKRFKFQAAGIAAGATRTFSMPNASGLVSLSDVAETISGQKTFSAIPILSSGGIKFPAAQVASSDPNVLDDYEEGTWTPSIKFGGASVGMTVSLQTGTYVKVGKAFVAQGRITLTAKGSSTGTASIEGLPFSGSTGTVGVVPFYTGMASLVDGLGGVMTGTTSLSLQVGGPATVTAATHANFTNTSDLVFCVTGREP